MNNFKVKLILYFFNCAFKKSWITFLIRCVYSAGVLEVRNNRSIKKFWDEQNTEDGKKLPELSYSNTVLATLLQMSEV
jgi:hypothetical protein